MTPNEKNATAKFDNENLNNISLTLKLIQSNFKLRDYEKVRQYRQLLKRIRN